MIRGVYAIVDVGADDELAALARLDGLLAGGVRLVQLRAKTSGARRALSLARQMRERTRAVGATFVVNDRPDLAVLAEADAVHLGQDDLPPEDARAIVPSSMRIGVSCHSLEDVSRALAAGADHLGFGPIYATSTKPDHAPVVGLAGLAAAARLAGAVPIVAIGGVEIAQLPELRAAGASAAAMIGALRDDPERRARAAISAWGAP